MKYFFNNTNCVVNFCDGLYIAQLLSTPSNAAVAGSEVADHTGWTRCLGQPADTAWWGGLLDDSVANKPYSSQDNPLVAAIGLVSITKPVLGVCPC